jgi:hypothetical protein
VDPSVDPMEVRARGSLEPDRMVEVEDRDPSEDMEEAASAIVGGRARRDLVMLICT